MIVAIYIQFWQLLEKLVPALAFRDLFAIHQIASDHHPKIWVEAILDANTKVKLTCSYVSFLMFQYLNDSFIF